jgi:hypothetical protein
MIATVMAADRDLASAEETVAMARQHGPCVAFEADVTKEKMLAGHGRRRAEKIPVIIGVVVAHNEYNHWTPMMPVVIGVAAATLC